MPAVDVSIQRPKIDDPALARTIAQITELLESLNGARRGRELDRVVTLRDLAGDTEAASIITSAGGVAGSLPSTIVSGGADKTPPAQLSNLTVASAAINNILSWDGTSLIPNYSYTEIWRASSDNLSLAVLHGTTTAEVFADDVGKGAVTYYYWVRAVSTAGIPGPYNATAGTSGTTGQVLNGDIADVAIDTAKIADLAVVTAKIANAAITNAKIANLAVDTAKIADLAVSSAKIANLAVGSAQIADAAIQTAKIADLAVDTLKIKDQAVTVPVSASADGALSLSSTVDTNIISASLDPSSSPVNLAISFVASVNGSDCNADAGPGYVEVRVVRGSTQIWPASGYATVLEAVCGSSAAPGQISGISLNIRDSSPAAGSNTYYVYARDGGQGGSVSFRSMVLSGVKK